MKNLPNKIPTLVNGSTSTEVSTGYDIIVKSVSDNPTEGTISLQEDCKSDEITLEDMEVPTATLSSGEGPRMSKGKKKPPTTKSEDLLW